MGAGAGSKEASSMLELLLVGCSGVVLLLHGASFFLRALFSPCHAAVARPVRFVVCCVPFPPNSRRPVGARAPAVRSIDRADELISTILLLPCHPDARSEVAHRVRARQSAAVHASLYSVTLLCSA